MGASKLNYVDFLRGIAILGVFWLHFTGDSRAMAWLPDTLKTLVQQGGKGVELFFVVSAFTLFRSYHHRGQHEPNPVRNFFIRRFFRIAPMYYLAILYYLWQNGTGGQQFLGATVYNTWDNILANFFFLQELNPHYMWLVPGSWSVTTEMFFYLFVPLLVRWIPNLAMALRFFFLATIMRFGVVYGIKLLHLFPQTSIWEGYLYFFLPNQLLVFAAGIVLYHLLSTENWPKIPSWMLLSLAVMIVLDFSTGGLRIFPLHFWFALAFVMLAVACSRFSFEHMVGRVVRHIGKVSFSLYLTHWAVMHGLSEAGLLKVHLFEGWGMAVLDYTWRFALALGIAVGISTLTYRFIEMPMVDFANRWIEKSKPKAT